MLTIFVSLLRHEPHEVRARVFLAKEIGLDIGRRVVAGVVGVAIGVLCRGDLDALGEARRVVHLVELTLKTLVDEDLRQRHADARQLANSLGDNLVRGDAVRIAAAVHFDADDVGWVEEPAPRVRRACFAPVSARMPAAIISRTTASSAAPVAMSTLLSDFTAMTRPGNGPGMPGTFAGA